MKIKADFTHQPFNLFIALFSGVRMSLNEKRQYVGLFLFFYFKQVQMNVSPNVLCCVKSAFQECLYSREYRPKPLFTSRMVKMWRWTTLWINVINMLLFICIFLLFFFKLPWKMEEVQPNPALTPPQGTLSVASCNGSTVAALPLTQGTLAFDCKKNPKKNDLR